jgi:hypothetical protein
MFPVPPTERDRVPHLPLERANRYVLKNRQRLFV